MSSLSLTPQTHALYCGHYNHTPEFTTQDDGTMIHLDHTPMPPLVVKAVHHAGDFVLVVMTGDDGTDELILMTQAEYASQV